MPLHSLTRRNFVKTSLYGLLIASAPTTPLLAQTSLRQRLDWDSFKVTSNYASFVSAIGKMRNNTNQADPNSWKYWAVAHEKYCPHSVAYFLAWHRGFLYYLEQRLRLVSGNSALNLPYWDYYKNPRLPAEFTNASSSNPLYVSRVNTSVSQALTMAPFSSTLINFPRGTSNAYEPSIEGKPHNPVHDIIGGIMATMQSPLDPIFWLHHANIDRLWNAWVAANSGRQMPASTSTYWSGTFSYATNLTMNRSSTINTRTKMGYFYQNEKFPTTLPATAEAFFEPVQVAMLGGAAELAALGGINNPGNGMAQRAPGRPPVRPFAASGARMIDNNRRSVGGARDVGLDERSVSARIALSPEDSQRLKNIANKGKAQPFGKAPQASAEPFNSVQVVLDNINTTQLGKEGGYFYNIFLNLPDDNNPATEDQFLLGNVGPFQIAGAQHHGNMARLVFPATDKIRNLTADQISELTVSFVRVSGDNAPAGQTIVMGEVRIEISTDDVE